MKPLFLCYAKCSTCSKAAKWLKERGIEVVSRDIVGERPTEEELRRWIVSSGLPIRKFFNTSGLLYKEMRMKERIPGASEEEMIAWLASDGKLVKRPLLIGNGRVLVGFKEEEWRKMFEKQDALCE